MRPFLWALPWVFLVAAVAAVGWLAWRVSDSLWGPAEPRARATTSTTATTQAPSSTTITATTVSDARSACARADGEGGAFGGPGDQAVSSVAAGLDSSPGNDDGAIWISADGYAWGRLPHDKALFGGPGRREIGFLIVGRAGSIAVGSAAMGGDDDATVWLSRSLG